MKKLLLSAAILPLSLTATAGSYQFEASAAHTYAETGDFNSDASVVAGTAYLNAVDDSKGPYAEAAFLNKASSLTLAYLIGDDDGGLDAETIAIDGEYVIPDSGYIFGLSYADGEAYDEDNEAYGLTFGKYLNDNMNVTLNYTSAESDLDVEADTITIATHIVSGEGAAGERIALDFAASRSDADYANGDDIYHTFLLGGTFYVSNQLGINFDWTLIQGGEDKGSIMAGGVEYFFIPQLAMALNYSYFSPDDDSLKTTDAITLSLTGRF